MTQEYLMYMYTSYKFQSFTNVHKYLYQISILKDIS